ncbi:MAG TPA: hypothetical protein VF979_11950 [Streptosporangiaceae bacterium]
MTASDQADVGVLSAVAEPWREASLPIADRVKDLLARMTLPEKLAQMYSVWLASPPDGNDIAPMQGEFTDGLPPFPELIRDGLGQLTRVFGSRRTLRPRTTSRPRSRPHHAGQSARAITGGPGAGARRRGKPAPAFGV